MKRNETFLASRGTSLIQMLVVITTLGFLSTAVITTMVSMMRAQGRAAGVWVVHHQWLRLTDDWRRDAHAAMSAEITQQNDSPAFVLRSSSASHRITYLAGRGEVTRRETDGDKLLRTETYRLPDWTVRFEASSTSAEQQSSESNPRSRSRETSIRTLTSSATLLSVNQTVQMICRHPNAPRPTPKTSVPLREDSQLAVIGRDHRFEKPIAETKSPE